MWPIFVDGKIDQRVDDLIGWPSGEKGDGVSGESNACHACMTHPFEVLWSLDDGCLLIANPVELTEKRKDNIFSPRVQGFLVVSILDRKVMMLKADRIGDAFFRRLQIPSDLGITHYPLWKSDDAKSEEVRVAEWIFSKNLTRMDKAAASVQISLPSLTAKPVLRELDLTGAAKSEVRNASKALVSVQRLGPRFNIADPAMASKTATFSTEESTSGTDNARGTKTRRPGFDQVMTFLNSSVPGVRETLAKSPKYYKDDYDSADFGYGLDFSYWLWKEENGAYLITTEAYESAGSSGVSTGRICIFRSAGSKGDAAVRCSMAD